MIGAVGVVIGLPAAFVLAVLAWGYLSDQTNGTIVSSGITRRYLLYVPETYDRARPTPLVISIHPAATWPAFERDISGWNDLANQHGFIVVYPAGTGAFFGGLSRGQLAWTAEPPGQGQDVRFIADLIDKLEADYHIDPHRIFANGMSNGGGMAFVLSCELSDRIAAVGVVAGAQPQSWDCADSVALPTVAFHGTADRFAPYLGGRSPIAPRPFASIRGWTAHVARMNRCRGSPTDTRITPNVRRRAYSSCADNAEVILYTIDGGGHTWPGGKPLPAWIAGRTSGDVSATKVMWDFFVRHPR